MGWGARGEGEGRWGARGQGLGLMVTTKGVSQIREQASTTKGGVGELRGCRRGSGRQAPVGRLWWGVGGGVGCGGVPGLRGWG